MEPIVGVVMGSASDWEIMQKVCSVLEELALPYENQVISGHRTPDLTFQYATEAKSRGLKVLIAGAGGAAHLAGMLAAKTTLPVIGVPMQTSSLNGLDSLLSIVQMPAGVPVATMAIGAAGAANAAWFAAQILSVHDEELACRLAEQRESMAQSVQASNAKLI